jgi:hypothetical protein
MGLLVSPIKKEKGEIKQKQLDKYWKFICNASAEDIYKIQLEQTQIQCELLFCASDLQLVSGFFIKSKPIDEGFADGSRLATFGIDRQYKHHCNLKEALLIAQNLEDLRYRITII